MEKNELLAKSLADLGNEDTNITMESTLARVTQLRAGRTRRRIASTVMATLALVCVGIWFLLPSSSTTPEEFTKNNTSETQPIVAETQPVAAETLPVAAETLPVASETVYSPAPAPSKAPYMKADRVEMAEVRHDVVLRALDFDKAVYEEITTTVGVNDDVVMISNAADKQTCLQVVCEGGDARTLYCSAPSPSPVMITSPSGRQMMRVEGGVSPTSHLVALRTKLHSDSVLVWYEASPAFLSRFRRAANHSETEVSATVVEQTLPRVDLERCAPSRMIDGSLRMDVTRCRSHARVVSVDMSDLAGRPIPVSATYSQGIDGRASIVLSSVPAGVAYVRLLASDGTSDTFPVAVP